MDIFENITITPYKPHLYWKLFRALQDEGISEDQMTFAIDDTYLLVDDDGYIGFFSFRMEYGCDELSLFLIFKNRRNMSGGIVFQMGQQGQCPLPRPFWCPAIAAVLMKIQTMVCENRIGDLREYCTSIMTSVLTVRKAGKDEPYAIDADGRRQYLIPALWRGGTK